MKARQPWLHTSMMAAFVALVLGAACMVPTSAHAVYVPSIGDTLMYSRSYAAETEAFPEAMALGPGNSVFYSHSDYNRPPQLPETFANYVIGQSSAGSEIFRAGSSDYSALMWPCAMDFTPQGDLIVADTEHHRIVKYNVSNGSVLMSFGSYGTDALQFSSPAGVVVAPDSTIWVADTYNDRVQHFTSAGLYLGEWSTGVGSYPDGIVVDSAGHLWVALSGSNMVRQYEPDGTTLQSISQWYERDAFGNPTVQDEFWGPRDVAIDPWGCVYVADTENGRVVRFTPQGEWLGAYNPGATLTKAGDIDIDAIGNVYVADYENDAVYKYSFVAAGIDDVPPVTTSNIPLDWRNAPLSVTLQSQDASNAVEATYYSTDGGDPTTLYEAPFTITQEGTTTVKYYSIDVAQNEETVKTEFLRIDSGAPTSTISVAPLTYGYSTTVSIAATDALSGVNRIVYIVDNGYPEYYAVPFTVMGLGNHYIDYYSQDIAGNTELIRRVAFTLEAPDTSPPTTTTNISAGWVNLNQSVQLTATDDVSGVAATYVSSDGSNPTQPYVSPIPVTTEGITTFKYYSVDHRGNVEPVKTSYVKLDKTPPSSTSDLEPSYVDSATITFDATDAVSGVLSIAASLDGGPWEYDGSVHTDEWGSHTIVWRATDYAGNQEVLRSDSFMVLQPDNEPPITADNISSSWTRGPYRIELTAYDVISSVDAIYYSTNGSFPTTRYTGPFDFNTEGSHTIKFYAIDSRGNAETVQSRLIQIDNTPPVSSSNAQSNYLGAATITMTTSDALSSVNGLWHRLDGGSWTKGASGSTVTTAAIGPHLLEYYAVDAASNVETTRSAAFTITPPDTVPPVTTFVGPSGWVKGPVTATLLATDTSSTVTGTWYSLDGSTPSIPYPGSIPISAEGTTTVKYRSTDFWNNLEDIKASTVSIDNSAPNTTSNALSTYVDQAVITLSPTDSLSGVATTKYRVDGGAWQTGTEVTVTGYWTHTVQFYSTDSVGNAENTKSVSFTIRRQDRTYHHTDSRILYKGSWALGYSDTSRKTSEPGAAAWFYTQASRIRYLAVRAPDAGIMRIRIDGGSWTNVDLYNSSTNTWQYVYDSGDIEFDYHFVEVEYTGTKNASSSGTAINLDGLVIEGNLLQVPDTAAPVTTSDIDTAWQRGPVTVNLTSTDATTGVAATYYSTDGTTPTIAYSNPVQITAEGTTPFRFYSVDKRGNAESVTTQNVRVDNSAPITTLPGNFASSLSTTSTVSLTAADPYSGVAYTRWRLDGGAWNNGTSVTIPGTSLGQHQIEWFSADAIGNIETTKSANVTMLKRFEQTEPALSYKGLWTTSSGGTLSGGTYKYGYSASSKVYTTFTGTRVDWVTSKNASYGKAYVVVDNGAPIEVDLYSSVLAPQQRVWSSGNLEMGVHTLRIEYTGTKNPASSGYIVGVDAIDVVGTLDADPAAPTTESSIDSAWRNTPQTVTLTANDTHSWVDATYYRIDGGTQTAYSAPFSVSGEGTSSIEFWSVDGVGNVESANTASVRIDTGLPTVEHNAPSEWTSGTVNVALQGYDALSGIDRVLYSTDGSNPTTVYGSPIPVATEGTSTLRFAAVDVAGNTGSTSAATVRIDNTAPSTNDDVEGWASGPVTVTLASGDGLSGVAHTQYRIDGGEPLAYDEPFVVSGDGAHSVEYFSVDRAGNTEEPRTATVRIDQTPPTTSSDAVASYTTTATVTLSAEDAGSGVAATQFSLDGGPWQNGTTVSTTLGGNHELQFRSTDLVGNVETVKTVSFSVRARSEQTANGIYYKGTWNTSASALRSGGNWAYTNTSGSYAQFRFAGTAFDLIGSMAPNLGKARVVVDGAEVGIADFYLSGYVHNRLVMAVSGLTNTVHTVRIEWTGTKNAASTGTGVGVDALDVVGYLVPDVTAPITEGTVNSAWAKTPEIVTLTGSDDDSWVTTIHYRIDGGTETTYTAPFSVSAEGEHTIEYRSVDAAGNSEAIKALTVRNDTTPPATTADAPSGWVADSAQVALSASDTHSGVASLLYSTDGSNPSIPYAGPLTIDTEGVHTVRYQAADNAGNSETPGSVQVKVDTDAPTITASGPDGWINTTHTLSLQAADSASGVERLFYGIDGADPATETTGTVTVADEGVHIVSYRAQDGVGHFSDTGSTTVRIDLTAPATGSDAVASYTTRADVSLTATDELSGVASTEYRLDGGSWTVGNAVSTTAGGSHTLEFRSRDAAGNTEDVQTATFTVKTRYEDDDSRIAYEGGWTKAANSKRSAGSWSYVNAAGAKAIIHFTGTTAELFASTAPTYGKASLSLDGGAPVTVDLYSAAYLHNVKVWSRTDLAETTHTVVVEWTGTKNAGSSGTGIGIDAFDMRASLQQVVQRYEETDTRMTWYGAWGSSANTKRSAGAWSFVNSADGAVNVSFNGTGIDLYGSTAPNYGKAKVTIDGTTTMTADFYTSGYLHNRKVLGVTGLANGPHTMTVEWTGTKTTASTGTGIGLDAVEVAGGIKQASPAGPALTRFEQTHSMIVYDGPWTTSSSASRSAGNWAYANAAGSAAYVTFTGTRIDLIGSTAPTYGKAKVTIDGTQEYTADFYTSGYLHNRKVLGITGLTAGPHTVAIEWTGAKNSSATGTGIGIDAVDVDGTLSQAVLPGYPVVTYEENDPKIAWTGSWASSASASRSGGAWAYSNTPTSTASFTFSGTRLEYYVSKAPTYGTARLTIDGVPHDVDLYSSGFVHNVLGWSSGKIADGVHTVTIEWTGNKNAGSTSTGIGVDALKVQGLMQ